MGDPFSLWRTLSYLWRDFFRRRVLFFPGATFLAGATYLAGVTFLWRSFFLWRLFEDRW